MFKKIAHTGSYSISNTYLRDRVILSNQLAIISIIIAAIHTIFTGIFIPQLTFLPGLSLLISFSVFALNAKGSHNLSRVLSGMNIPVLVIFYTAALVDQGEEIIGANVFGAAAFSIFPFILFDTREKRYIYTFMAFVIINFTLHEYINELIEVEVDDTMYRARWFIYFTYFSCSCVFVGALYFMNRKSHKTDIEKEKLLSQVQQYNEELKQQQEEVVSQRDYIAQQHQLVKSQNAQVTDSIRYAKTIQDTLLPFSSRIQQSFSDHFVIYRAKDIVSGDFYWLEQVDNQIFISVIDCTGHGVPGALMSMIGFAILNEQVLKAHKTGPAAILAGLNDTLTNVLNEQGEGIQDGMDMGLCALENLANGNIRIRFSGAKRPLYYILPNDNQLHKIKGTRKSINGFVGNRITEYQQHEIEVPKGTCLYLCTDGLADQNSAENKKFGNQQLRSLLASNASLEMKTQKEKILDALTQHQGDIPQRDDITLIGIRL